ncbi:PQ loop repeat family protein [Tritrichomonas foetus]|uniref:PQ loop repeat family protein n=1 Tax=Tritrichomonas foetus TaxID=1144522 RepID=A0A1J4KTS0_9EUKA|nr:PQ loop repeat family protein [Tritrichomonas foetus]|eukprot:OHT14312.1 PQ loop repeat family protein [Tritrichomonas foetus]
MSEEFGHGITFELVTGFLDYNWRFPKVNTFWLIIGVIFFVVSFVSFLPQPFELVTARSSFGIEPVAIFCQSLGHFLLMVNLLCFKCFDFCGFLQYPNVKAIPRVLTFCNMFFQWILFLPTIFLSMIYHDREYRESRKKDKIRIDWIKSATQCGLVMVSELSLVLIWVVIGLIKGFETTAETAYGEALGTIATALEFVFFLPQMITTCRLRDGGSLSLLMLEIQAPADLCNAMFMWFGTKDHWTTWLTIFVDGIEGLLLLGTCLFFNCLKSKRAREAERDRLMIMSLNASMEPEPLLFDKF